MIEQFVNCKTTGVIYMAQCECPMIYVGKTIQSLRRRISQHLSTINRGLDTPISRHIRLVHGGDVECAKILGY